MDVKGKVLLMLVNEPPSDDPKFFKGKALTYYGRWTYKYEEAARKGAVGAILIHQTEMASYPWEVVRNSNSGEKSYLKLDGTPKLKVASWIQLDVAKELADACRAWILDKMMADARSRDFHPVPLPVKLKAHMVSKIRPFESNNVIAMLPGSDAKIEDEAVLYTAHYDHLGIRPDMPGDNIYNGADDNATGCGILLEMARAFAMAAQKPRRSIMFASVTAEEQGLLGSEYLGKHPPIPAGKITLDLNYDDIPPLGSPGRSGSFGQRSARLSIPRCRRWRRNFVWRFVPMRIPRPDTTIAPITSAWRASAFPRSPSTKASSTRATTRPGACSRPRNTPRSTITSRAMNIIPRWTSPATP